MGGMATRTSFWRSGRWREVLLPDSRLASAEGLAAGTGLLTGSVARSAANVQEPCPECRTDGDVVVIDLIDQAVSLRCPRCGHRWNMRETSHLIQP